MALPGWVFKTVNPRGPVKPECDRVSAIHGKKPGPFYCFRKFLKKSAIFNFLPVGADPGDNHGDSECDDHQYDDQFNQGKTCC